MVYQSIPEFTRMYQSEPQCNFKFFNTKNAKKNKFKTTVTQSFLTGNLKICHKRTGPNYKVNFRKNIYIFLICNFSIQKEQK